MKPGDHPEFFRFPPPEGRSRESSIRLTKEGRFFHDGAPVEHPGMHKAFASWLRRHPDDGRFILSNGYDWSYLTVEGASRFVHHVRDRGGKPTLELLDGQELELAPESLWTDAEGALWARLPEGESARFTPAAQLEIAPWLQENEGHIGIQVEGRFFGISAQNPAAGA
ncbi:MAG: hypothetical protein EOO73_20275 [Myxococcales bacterium]|nr:MAG: hypothetical protein EOO73_20275 [Myxococcales bacterium]